MNKQQIREKFSDLDILIHLAWVGSDRKNRAIPEIQKTNILIVENIVKILKFTNISRIFGIGSQDELLNGQQPWNDNSKISPSSEYAKAKFKTFKLAPFKLLTYLQSESSEEKENCYKIFLF